MDWNVDESLCLVLMGWNAIPVFHNKKLQPWTLFFQTLSLPRCGKQKKLIEAFCQILRSSVSNASVEHSSKWNILPDSKMQSFDLIWQTLWRNLNQTILLAKKMQMSWRFSGRPDSAKNRFASIIFADAFRRVAAQKYGLLTINSKVLERLNGDLRWSGYWTRILES